MEFGGIGTVGTFWYGSTASFRLHGRSSWFRSTPNSLARGSHIRYHRLNHHSSKYGIFASNCMDGHSDIVLKRTHYSTSSFFYFTTSSTNTNHRNTCRYTFAAPLHFSLFSLTYMIILFSSLTIGLVQFGPTAANRTVFCEYLGKVSSIPNVIFLNSFADFRTCEWGASQPCCDCSSLDFRLHAIS